MITSGKLSSIAPKWFKGWVLAVIMAFGCARGPVTLPEHAFRETTPPTLSDDLALSELTEAITADIEALRASPDKVMRFGPHSITRRAYAEALIDLRQVLSSTTHESDKLNYIRDNFLFMEFYGGDRWGEVLLTSYFEPLLPGSKTRTKTLNYPLYGQPADLVTIHLARFSERFKDERALKARVDGAQVVPYYSRQEIDAQQKLANKGLELAWVDPIDAFFLHIQGSGTVKFEHGEEAYMTYADKNGHKYEPVGKFLRNVIGSKKITMQRIEQALRSMSDDERDSYLLKNPSYVFFNRSKKRAITSLGVPATPGRTIAVDPRYAPKGALAVLTFQKPVFSPQHSPGDDPISYDKVSRFVLDQDSGGAITGTNRVDLFWGRGDSAKQYAGVIQDTARLLYLLPKQGVVVKISHQKDLHLHPALPQLERLALPVESD
jgi:membrane-bound lytic murein transglycosylase A